VQLQDADLSLAEFQGANLGAAQLQGADLSRAQLQGADLYNAEVADSNLAEAFVFRTNIGGVDFSTAVIPSIHANQVKLNESGEVERLAQSDITAWIEAVSKFATEEATKERFARLKLGPGFQTPAEDVADVTKWTELTKESRASDLDGYSKRLGEALAELICDDQGAPDVARGLIRYGRLGALGDQLNSIRTRIKEGRGDPDTCPGVAGFTEDDWKLLDALIPD
jgi:Pentapeptide repeats (8 copies)